MLVYLHGTSRRYLSMLTRQCAKLYPDPTLSHERAVNKSVRYSLDTRHKGITVEQDLCYGSIYGFICEQLYVAIGSAVTLYTVL